MSDYSDLISGLRQLNLKFTDITADALEAQAKRIEELEAVLNDCIKIAEEDEGCQISHIEGIPCEAGEKIADKIREKINGSL